MPQIEEPPARARPEPRDTAAEPSAAGLRAGLEGVLGRLPSRRALRWALVLVVLLSASATIAGMRRTSTTFDEIVTVAAGVRGYATGHWDLTPDGPPITNYLYALPVWLSGVRLPQEVAGVAAPGRYPYAQALYWMVGNDPERIAFLSRCVAVLIAAGLVLLTFGFVRTRFGELPALLAAALVAFLPDVLAHGGIAYNDVPLAACFLAATWALDAAVRRPTPWRGALAGALVGLSLAVKFSAIALVPTGVLLLLAEGASREDRGRWLRAAALAAALALVAGYLALVLAYRGDPSLHDLRMSFRLLSAHLQVGQPAYLLGRFHAGTPWYFYPVAFLFKTPAALHLLLLIAALGFATSVRPSLRGLLASHLRMPVIGIVVFGLALVRSNLAIGFRYALPLLPMICILAAVGVSRAWPRLRPSARAATLGLVLWFAASPLLFYPDYLAYTSEYVPDKDMGYTVFTDSSQDWGQGLLELRRWMREEHVPHVYLSYFGSALPYGYGINYLPLPSFFPLMRPHPAPGVSTPPRFVVISATNLTSEYFRQDVFRRFRELRPYRVLGHSLFVYRLEH